MLLTDRISLVNSYVTYETGILTTEYIPVVLLIDRINGTGIMTTKYILTLFYDNVCTYMHWNS